MDRLAYTVQEIAALTPYSERTILGEIRGGKLPADGLGRPGSPYVVTRTNLLAWLEKRSSDATARREAC